jgi:hypothetical protein
MARVRQKGCRGCCAGHRGLEHTHGLVGHEFQGQLPHNLSHWCPCPSYPVQYEWVEQERSRLLEEVHNLKGNIRVMVRVRAVLPSEACEGAAPLEFPDASTKGVELAVVRPPAPGVDGAIRKSEPQRHLFDRCRAH